MPPASPKQLRSAAASGPTSGRWLTLGVCLGLAAATLGVYWQVRGFSFVNFDDPSYVTENLNVQNGLTSQGLAWAFTSSDAANWHPLTWLSHMLDVQLFGPSAAGWHHLTSLFLHVASAILLFLVLRRMTARLWPSAFVAALFALHPLHVESVAWVAERKDVLSTFFMMLTLWAYVSWTERRGLGRYLLTVVLFALGLLAKPMLVTLPLVLLLLDFWPLGRWRLFDKPLSLDGRGWPAGPGEGAGRATTATKNRNSRTGINPVPTKTTRTTTTVGGMVTRSVAMSGGRTTTTPSPGPDGPSSPGGRVVTATARTGQSPVPTKATATTLWRLLVEKLPLFALAAASCIATVVAQHSGGAVANVSETSPEFRVANALASYGRYLAKTVWPADLSFFYQGNGQAPWLEAAVMGTLLLAITLVVILTLRRRPYLATGWFWYLGTLVPVIGLVQVGSQTMADRYTYVPLIGLFIMVAWAAADLAAFRPRLRPALAAAGLAVLVGCGWATYFQAGVWRNSAALCRQALKEDNQNIFANHGLGNALLDEGDACRAAGDQAAATRKYEEAAAHYRAALKAMPNYAESHAMLGSALADLGQADAAISEYREAVRLLEVLRNNPVLLAKVRTNYAVALTSGNKIDEAIAEYRQALAVTPNDAAAHNNLGDALLKKNQLPEAADEFRRAIAGQGRLVEPHFNLAVVLQQQGHLAAALEEYLLTLQLDPNHAGAAYRAVWIMSAAADERVRNGPQAVALGRRACEMPGVRREAMLDALASAYAEAGQFDEAVRTAQEALDLTRKAGEARLAASLEIRLELYRQHRPFHDPTLVTK